MKVIQDRYDAKVSKGGEYRQGNNETERHNKANIRKRKNQENTRQKNKGVKGKGTLIRGKGTLTQLILGHVFGNHGSYGDGAGVDEQGGDGGCGRKGKVIHLERRERWRNAP